MALGKAQPRHARRQAGLTLIEVLVTLVIIAIGLLGIAGLQARLHISEMESYQRSQALLLLQDMVSRINANRQNAAAYLTTASPMGTGHTPATNCAALTSLVARDLCEWSHALQGAAETVGTSRIGAMVGARGCVEQIPGTTNEFLLTVAWQGLAPLAAPSANVTCGAGSYAGGNCTGELCRRVVTTLVRIAG